MKTALRKVMLFALATMTFVLASCDNEDWRLEQEIVGAWHWYYEDRELYEEIIYSFTPDGKWVNVYMYEDIYGKYNSDVDGGYYSINFGQLNLYSNFYGDNYSYDIDIHRNRMYLWDGEYETELIRIN